MSVAAEQINNDNVQVFIGRQPILDRELNTYAYELLFRPGAANEADFLNGEKATAQVIHNTLMEIGLDELVGNCLAYINFTRDSLLNDYALLLPADRVVLEVLEDVEIDDSLTQTIKALTDEGFTIALDDFEYETKWEPLLALAGVIKFDVQAIGLELMSDQLELVDKHKFMLLAEKVETREEFEQLKAMGFDYFQGYFFAKPTVISGKKLPDNQLALLNLISRLQDPEIQVEEVEQLVSHTISLSVKLLRYINSASFSLPTKVNSIRQLVIFFGMQRLKNWASLIVMAEISDKPSELLQTGLIRAKMCEMLADALGRAESESYFMLGLFSILDALMDSEMQDVLDNLPISEDLKNALLTQEGEMGAVLACCIACEQNNWSAIGLTGVKAGKINRVYMEAIIWSRQAMTGLR